MKRTWMAATAVSVVVFITGCESMTSEAEPPPLDGTAWVLSSLRGGAPLAGPRATAQFEAGRVQGSDGCNRFTAPYTTKGSAIQIGQGASTQMACPPETMKQAQAFMAALSGAKSYRVHDGELQLLAADGAVLSSFAAQSQSLAGTSWRATGINNGRQAVVSLVAGSSVTMEFAADGKVSGSAGCNRYTATYQADGRKLRFGPAAATRRMCAAVGVMEQERAFLKALETVATMRMEGDRLELRTAEGALAATLVRNGPS
jgi:heat shock protein HslJ